MLFNSKKSQEKTRKRMLLPRLQTRAGFTQLYCGFTHRGFLERSLAAEAGNGQPKSKISANLPASPQQKLGKGIAKGCVPLPRISRAGSP